jgi:hypothetical protein
MQFPSGIPRTDFGIYSITCRATGSIYVGSTSRSFWERWDRHVWALDHKSHDNPLLQVDWNTYGPDTFLFAIVEILTLLELIRDREKYWISQFRESYLFIYNLANIVRSTKPLPPLVWLTCQTCDQPFPVRARDAERRKPLYCSNICRWNFPIEKRFWAKVDRSGGPDACWPWLACSDDKGYGWFSLPGGRHVHASRFSYELANGPLSQKEVVRHTCDWPPCVQPQHLINGSNAQNTQDARDRGRLAKGSQHGMAKLTEDLIPLIRSFRGNLSSPKVAALLKTVHGLNVTDAAIKSVWREKTWKHVK